ncbi:MAG: hypothetical protein EBZ48_05665 [Proteobacteria bacterium]|nr:hypothetical protein [Pseudomonadota bacterium]
MMHESASSGVSADNIGAPALHYATLTLRTKTDTCGRSQNLGEKVASHPLRANYLSIALSKFPKIFR